MRTVAIIQARLGSTRLPGKVLLRLGNRTVLGHVLTRVQRCPDLDGVVVATTDTPADEAIATETARYHAEIYRGQEQDILDRYYRAALAAQADTIVRLTADCPLLDPELMSDMLKRFNRTTGRRPDYLSNTLQRTYPRGLDTEIFTFAALERAWREAREPHQREHVTPYFYQHPELFNLESYEGRTNLSKDRWTLDTPEDLRFLEAVFRLLAPDVFSTASVFEVLTQHPELRELNAHVEQKQLGN